LHRWSAQVDDSTKIELHRNERHGHQRRAKQLRLMKAGDLICCQIKHPSAASEVKPLRADGAVFPERIGSEAKSYCTKVGVSQRS